METTQQEQSKPLPAWASILVILLCLSGSGWIMHWYLTGQSLNHEATLLGPPNALPMPRPNRANPANQPPTIHKESDNPPRWMVRSTEAIMFVTQAKNQPPVIRSLNYIRYDFIPRETLAKVFAARRIVRDDTVAKFLKATPEQMKQLRSLAPPPITMMTQPADLEQLKTEWTAYQSATDKTAAENILMNAMNDIARNDVNPTRDATADRATKITSVLTPDQWKQFEAMGR